MAGENEIVFEDLRGVQDEGTVEVDLDKDGEDHGIVRRPTVVDDDDDKGKRKDGDDDDDDDPDEGDDGDGDRRRAGDGDNDDDDGDGDRDGDDDGDDGDDDDGYSRRVRARIQRATRATVKEKERADYWEEQAKKAAKELAETRKVGSKKVIERALKEIETVESQIEAAVEAGQTKEQVRLISRLTDLKAEKVRAEAELENTDTDTGFPAGDDGRVRTSRADSRTPAKATAWMEKHSDWYGARGFERQTRLANRIDKEVYADGYDPTSDEYYKELNRRIKQKEPELFGGARTRDTKGKDGDGRRRRSPVAGVDGGEPRRSTRSGKVELTESDFANMRRFNLDPNDPQVLREYARNKRESESGAQR